MESNSFASPALSCSVSAYRLVPFESAEKSFPITASVSTPAPSSAVAMDPSVARHARMTNRA